MKNGTIQRLQGPVQKPPPPPEAADWVIDKVPPELIEEAVRTFDMEEFMASEREIEETGGLRFEDFIDDLKRAAGEHD